MPTNFADQVGNIATNFWQLQKMGKHGKNDFQRIISKNRNQCSVLANCHKVNATAKYNITVCDAASSCVTKIVNVLIEDSDRNKHSIEIVINEPSQNITKNTVSNTKFVPFLPIFPLLPNCRSMKWPRSWAPSYLLAGHR